MFLPVRRQHKPLMYARASVSSLIAGHADESPYLDPPLRTRTNPTARAIAKRRVVGVIKDMLVDKERQVAGLSSRRHKKRSRYLRTARVNPKQVSAILSSTKNTTYVVPVAAQQGCTHLLHNRRCSIDPDNVDLSTIQQWREELQEMQLEEGSAGYGRRTGYQPTSSLTAGKRTGSPNRRPEPVMRERSTLSNSMALLSSQASTGRGKARGRRHVDYASNPRPTSLSGGAPKAVHTGGEAALRATASTYRPPVSAVTPDLRSTSPSRLQDLSMDGDAWSPESQGRGSRAPAGSPHRFAFHTMNVLVESPGSTGVAVEYVGGHPRKLIASTSLVDKSKRASSASPGARGRGTKPAVFRGALYKTSASLGKAGALHPSRSVRPNTTQAVIRKRGFVIRNVKSRARSQPHGSAPDLPAPSPNAKQVRLGQTFALVDRLGAPQRMPPMLREFWEHNPDLLPDWAGDEVRPVTSVTAKRRLASLDEPSHVDFNMSTTGVEKIKRVQWKSAARDTFEEGSLDNIGVSVEMQVALGDYMSTHMGTGLWDDEVASMLAAPLNANHMTRSRQLHLAADETGKKFRGLDATSSLLGPPSVLFGTGDYDKFPYGQDAHAAAACIERG